ncbi:3-deoxy-manno-octulosonate cytidylyltransferase (CMP-KDO synthetase) [Orenia metallireducens]|uniref:3-deoxy-manno-octulosonate cytidylyltransferase n=1 Tax=Orenia metallireducens TaxID=1413210 RepID=A0A285GMB7_9FIRM|nr:3-deoxy-manno-octulosonate cytidylyltransferase [Orenia metallireducens]PRX35720.1 3-deoxy-manno-octulosonate cytidylyltransferase (CMP-KDO synthetase) [Orenia metallireducens]SNY24354.1 3-deoxy-manno-octulosonate cytidylyltransferase (CMP-KDO synthetase) [Orenia metallireducens]
MRVTAIIPARYASTRLPGKPLKDICGKPMIQRVYEQVKLSSTLDRVIVATDDKRIYDAVKAFDGEVAMTSAEHKTGTDRLAEVAKGLSSEIIVNVQGDEPLISPEMIDQAVRPLLEDHTIKMGTLKQRIDSKEELESPHVVKVVTDRDDFALYFSRSLIPYPRTDVDIRYYKHIGLYVYRKEFLLNYAKMETTTLELKESLEQLRALENGYKIKVVETEHQAIGVDTEKDLERVRAMYNDQ